MAVTTNTTKAPIGTDFNTEEDYIGVFVCVMFIIAIIAGFILTNNSYINGQQDILKKAVKLGYAETYLQPDNNYGIRWKQQTEK